MSETVSRNHKLAQHIGSASWSKFLRGEITHMNKNDIKQELSSETDTLAIGPNKIPTSRDLILQLYERVISEIMNAVSRSEDYIAIHSCIMKLHMPEDLNNPEKIKKVAQDILYMNNDACIRDRIIYLTGRLCAATDMYSTLCACEVSQSNC